MHKKRVASSVGKRPTVLGTGLVALDAVVSVDKEYPVRYWAGGTCGNVLIALRYLGWIAQPIARLANDDASEALVADLRRWRISQRFLRSEADGSTPVIVEYITKDAAGRPKHSFSWRCDACGARYPSYRPELLSVVEQIAQKLSSVSVFFFDRLSAGALHLARVAAEKGALVVFEPSGTGNPVHFQQAWEIAHVVKYSHERLSEFPDTGLEAKPRLIIETLGSDGLRYRWRKAGMRFEDWVRMPAFPIDDLKDAAGAGDWCTAGVVSKLGAAGQAGLQAATKNQIHEAMLFGQALAAWTCRFEGARGGMYAVSRKQFNQQVEDILSGNANVIPMRPTQNTRPVETSFCRICEAPTSSRRRKAPKHG